MPYSKGPGGAWVSSAAAATPGSDQKEADAADAAKAKDKELTLADLQAKYAHLPDWKRDLVCRRALAKQAKDGQQAQASQRSTSAMFSKKSAKGGPVKLFQVDVAAVPTVGDPESFKAQHVDDRKWPKDVVVEGEASLRVTSRRDVYEIQLARWNWVRKDAANLHTFINMLRVCGHADDCIQAMCDGVRPLNFSDAAMHAAFVGSLRGLASKLEAEYGWTGVRFIQTGSSVPGYSSNPQKGKRNVPTKITSCSSSDVDVIIAGTGVGAWGRDQLAAGKCRKFDSDMPYEERGDRPLFGFDDPKSLGGAIAAWVGEWEVNLKGGVQLTFAEHPSPKIYPWQCWIRL